MESSQAQKPAHFQPKNVSRSSTGELAEESSCAMSSCSGKMHERRLNTPGVITAGAAPTMVEQLGCLVRGLGVAANHQERRDRERGRGVSGEECESDPG